ncbi:MAG TPA: DUF2089 family protein [archaeon]|nr:DUF2089 family protein [archaeon]
MANKSLPAICPSCQRLLDVRRLECSGCGTAVEGDFDLPLLARLSTEDQEFILNLLKASGSLKELASLYGISYPTIRNRLDSLIEKVERIKASSNSPREE